MASPTAPVRVRFAPSPTGTLHVGGARTALFNYLLARKTGGAFVVRVEDTDEARARAESEQAILRDLRWLGLEWDEGPQAAGKYGPYRQSERLEMYRDIAAKLVELGKAYRCYCSASELEAARSAQHEAGIAASRYAGTCRTLGAAERAANDAQGRPFSVRFIVPPGQTVVDDVIKGPVTFDNHAFGDFVIVKTAGGPTYNFAAALDDATMEITLVLRGDEHLSNTPLQLMVLAALGLSAPRYAHVPLILNEQHQKLSKRHQTVDVESYRAAGFLAPALVNHLALLGWSPGDEREFFTLPELIAAFSLDRVGKSPAVYNEARLRAFNQHYLRALPPGALRDMLAAAMREHSLLEDPAPPTALRWIETFLEAYGEGLHSVAEAIPLVAALRAESVVIPALELERLRSREVLFFLDAVGQYVDKQPELRGLPLGKVIPAIAEEFGLAKKDAYHAVRMALTGEEKGAPLNLLFPLLGHERIIMRIAAVSSHLLHGRGLEPIRYGPGGQPFEPIRGSGKPSSADV